MEQFDLSDFFTTKSEATDFSTRLANLSEKVYETNFQLENALMDTFGIQKKEKFMTLIRENTVNITSNTALQEFFKKIQEKISSLPLLSIKIAFQPTKETLKSISQWFLFNTKRQVLLDITIDSNLIAGAEVSYNGKYVDFSIRTIFNRILKEMQNSTTQVQIITKPSTPPVATSQPSQQQNTAYMNIGR